MIRPIHHGQAWMLRGASEDAEPTRERLDLRARSISRDLSAEFVFTTGEGDTVTLSASVETDVTYASLRYLSRSDGESTRLRGSLEAISVDRSLTLTVEGDLSEQELADITAFLDRVGPRFNGLLHGRGASRSLWNPARAYDSLSGIEMTLSDSRQRTDLRA